jgi:16S rRNA (cytidine1402-2'-O)-methyltransferase
VDSGLAAGPAADPGPGRGAAPRSSGRGALVLVATPIGNLGDLSPRAVDTLAGADAIACEDTRRTGRLLQLAGLARPPLLTVNDHTEAARIGEVLARVARGQRVALVTDAGTPGVSDPGERMVRAVAAAGHRVELVPGPSAAVAALVLSGLPTGRFVFEGFLPRRGSGRAERLAALAGEERTVVLYEAPHRLQRSVADLAAALGGERRVAIARELTKLHEEMWRGTLTEAVEWTTAQTPRGELVLVVEGAPPAQPAGEDELRRALEAELATGVAVREAATVVARRLGVPRRQAYQLAIAVRAGSETT